MVRLEGLIEKHEKAIKVLFQFQYGAIRSKPYGFGYINSRSFNSSMVRLEVTAVLTVDSVPPYFNSSMVRLEEHSAIFTNILQCYFNSSMVRLEDL